MLQWGCSARGGGASYAFLNTGASVTETRIGLVHRARNRPIDQLGEGANSKSYKTHFLDAFGSKSGGDHSPGAFRESSLFSRSGETVSRIMSLLKPRAVLGLSASTSTHSRRCRRECISLTSRACGKPSPDRPPEPEGRLDAAPPAFAEPAAQ